MPVALYRHIELKVVVGAVTARTPEDPSLSAAVSAPEEYRLEFSPGNEPEDPPGYFRTGALQVAFQRVIAVERVSRPRTGARLCPRRREGDCGQGIGSCRHAARFTRCICQPAWKP